MHGWLSMDSHLVSNSLPVLNAQWPYLFHRIELVSTAPTFMWGWHSKSKCAQCSALQAQQKFVDAAKGHLSDSIVAWPLQLVEK